MSSDKKPRCCVCDSGSEDGKLKADSKCPTGHSYHSECSKDWFSENTECSGCSRGLNAYGRIDGEDDSSEDEEDHSSDDDEEKIKLEMKGFIASDSEEELEGPSLLALAEVSDDSDGNEDHDALDMTTVVVGKRIPKPLERSDMVPIPDEYASEDEAEESSSGSDSDPDVASDSLDDEEGSGSESEHDGTGSGSEDDQEEDGAEHSERMEDVEGAEDEDDDGSSDENGSGDEDRGAAPDDRDYRTQEEYDSEDSEASGGSGTSGSEDEDQ